MIETNATKLEFEDDEVEYVLSKGKEKPEVADRFASAITIVPWLTEWLPGAEPQGDDNESMVHYQADRTLFRSMPEERSITTRKCSLLTLENTDV